MRVTVESQPREFIAHLPPDTRKQLREALHGVERGNNHPVPLTDKLDGFYKLRVGNHRLILQAAGDDRGPFFRVVFVERRAAVYELFGQILGLE